MIWFWKTNSSPMNQKNKEKKKLFLMTSGCTTSRSIFPLEIVKKTKEIQIKPSLTSSWKAELDDLSLLERIRLMAAAAARPCITPANNQHRKDWYEMKNWKALLIKRQWRSEKKERDKFGDSAFIWEKVAFGQIWPFNCSLNLTVDK